MRVQNISFRWFGALLWRAGWLLHRPFFRASGRRPSLPLIVIGAVRAGGAGKTPVVRQIVQQLTDQGLRVGVMVYSVESRNSGASNRVAPMSDWRASSEEAVWLARNCPAIVWGTRSRWQTWQQIAQQNEVDVLVSDDGLEDPRLQGALRYALDWGDSAERIGDLVPAGLCRSWWSDHKGVVRWKVGEHVHFATKLDLVPQKIAVLCGLGDPCRFLSDLESLGFVIVEKQLQKDHSHGISHALNAMLAKGCHPIVLTEKDAIKITPKILAHPRVMVATQEVLIPLLSATFQS